jgi:D-sedoheptulose 7-phosphate isomerase
MAIGNSVLDTDPPFDARTFITSRIRSAKDLKQKLLEKEPLLSALESSASAIVDCYRGSGKTLFCGNGGSAADAQHLAAELSGRFYYDRPPLCAEALHANTSYLTAVANDYSYDEVYSRLVRGMGRAGDVLVGLSTSGNSGNVVRAFQAANELGMITVAFTGEGGGKLREEAKHLISVPSKDTPRIQECHILLGHILCEMVESALFPRT